MDDAIYKGALVDERSVWFSRIPTTTSRQLLVTRYLNDILEENPEFIPMITAIATYPLQDWANNARKTIQCSPVEIQDIIMRCTDCREDIREAYDVTSQLKFADYDQCIEITEMILAFVRNAVEDLRHHHLWGESAYEVVRKIHLVNSPEEDVSYYSVKRYYPEAVRAICRRNYKSFNRLIQEMSERYGTMDPELLSVYHSTEILISWHANTTWNNPDFDLSMIGERQAGALQDIIRISQIITSAAAMLKTYPFQGQLLHSLAPYVLKGWNNNMIVKAISNDRYIARSTMAIYRREIMNALSSILWGYTTQDILDTFCRI